MNSIQQQTFRPDQWTDQNTFLTNMKVESDEVQPIVQPQPIHSDMSGKSPFHFLYVIQLRLANAKTKELKKSEIACPYPKETKELWESLEKAVNEKNRIQAQNLFEQLFPGSGTLIKPQEEPFESPQNNSEKIVNVFFEMGHFIEKPMPEILLGHGISRNIIPMIYLALKCGANPENIFTGIEGQKWHALRVAIENNCDIAGIRLLFQFAGSPTNLANESFYEKRFCPLYPLKVAFEFGRADVVRELLINGANPDIAWDNSIGEEDLYLNAVGKAHAEVVQLFLQAGFPTDYQNKEGNSALHFAKAKKYESLVDDLLRAGVNPQLINKNGQTYLQYADEMRKKHDETARKMLVPAFQRGEFVHIGRLTVSEIISHLSDINESVDDKDNTLLHLAMTYIVTSVDKFARGIRGVRDFISKGGDTNRKNREGETPREIVQNAVLALEKRIELLGSDHISKEQSYLQRLQVFLSSL